MNYFKLLGLVFGLAGMLSQDRGRGVLVVDLAAGAIGLAIVLLAVCVY